jgi:hypothetical protein
LREVVVTKIFALLIALMGLAAAERVPAETLKVAVAQPGFWNSTFIDVGLKQGYFNSDRFLLGSDTWINERWFGYDTIMQTYRAWLAQLPEAQARRIAHGNAERLFGGKVE